MSSYLAQLDEHQLGKQIQNPLNGGFVPAIEYVAPARSARERAAGGRR